MWAQKNPRMGGGEWGFVERMLAIAPGGLGGGSGVGTGQQDIGVSGERHRGGVFFCGRLRAIAHPLIPTCIDCPSAPRAIFAAPPR